MKALLRTADELEAVIDIPKFTHEIHRPIVKQVRHGEIAGFTVTHVRIYSYYANRLSDDAPIYKEVLG